MKYFFLTTLFFAGVLFTQAQSDTTQSQEDVSLFKHQIGAVILGAGNDTDSPLPGLHVTYRNGRSNGFWHADFRTFSRGINFGPRAITFSDTLFEEQHHYKGEHNIQIGAGRQWYLGKQKIFSIGFAPFAGVTQVTQFTNTTGLVWSDSLQNWIPYEYPSTAAGSNGTISYLKPDEHGGLHQTFLTGGLELSATVRATISKRFGLSIVPSIQFLAGTEVARRESGDPNLLIPASTSYLEGNAFAELFLTYRLK